MNDDYAECLVARKASGFWRFLKYLLIMLTALACLITFGTGNLIVFIVAIALGVGVYFVSLNADIEYEYLYFDKEITVDKILNKTRRKRVAVFEMDKIEIMAPLKSYHLDNFKNRTFKEVDYSSGIAGMPEVRYCFYYNGTQKVIFEPDQAMMKMIRNVSPRKIFMD